MYNSYDAKQQIIAFCFSSTSVVPWLQTYACVINSIHFNYYFEHEVHWMLKKNSVPLVPAVLHGIFSMRSSFRIHPKAYLSFALSIQAWDFQNKNNLHPAGSLSEPAGSTVDHKIKVSPLMQCSLTHRTLPMATNPDRSQSRRGHVWQGKGLLGPALPCLLPVLHINYSKKNKLSMCITLCPHLNTFSSF